MTRGNSDCDLNDWDILKSDWIIWARNREIILREN
jgi:hypothetical protein